MPIPPVTFGAFSKQTTQHWRSQIELLPPYTEALQKAGQFNALYQSIATATKRKKEAVQLSKQAYPNLFKSSDSMETMLNQVRPIYTQWLQAQGLSYTAQEIEETVKNGGSHQHDMDEDAPQNPILGPAHRKLWWSQHLISSRLQEVSPQATQALLAYLKAEKAKTDDTIVDMLMSHGFPGAVNSKKS